MSILENKTIKTNAISLFLLAITGAQPEIIKYPEYNELVLSNNQNQIIRELLNKMLSADPGNVRINLKPIITPIVLRRYWPWLAGVGAGVLILGGILKR